ncbi:MAG TPA: type 4a pilus biogenesis protein PilO [Longimicrobiales bacterium]|nr:type 4a pilus biogenesis protein PilO [Longimicrobiales bacterium]
MALLPKDPQKQKLVLIGLIPVLLAFAFYYLVYTPRAEQIATLQDEFDRLEASNAATEAGMSRYGANLSGQLEIYKQHMTIIERLIPRRNDIPNLLVAMGEQAQAYNVVWGGFSPSVEEPGPYYDRAAYEISVTGTYHDVGAYLAAVGSLPRIVKPTSVRLSVLALTAQQQSRRRADAPPLLKASFQIETYVAPQPGQTDDTTAGGTT